MIPDPWINIPVAFTVIASVTCAIGMFYWFNMSLNLCTTIFAVMAVGLAVDYAAHLGHMFRFSNEPDTFAGDEIERDPSTGEVMAIEKSGDQRALDTMRRIGTAVFNAVFTTFLAVTVLSQAKSFVFYTFFQVLALVNILSGASGLFVLPVILAIVHGGSKVPEKKSKVVDQPDS